MKVVFLLLLVCVAGLALAMPQPFFGYKGDDDLDTGEAERREIQALAAQLRALDTAGETRENVMYAHGFPGAAEGYGQQAEQKRKRLFEMLTSGQSGGKLDNEGDGDLDTGEAERREFRALAAQLRALDTTENVMYAHGFPGAAEGYGQQAEQKRKRLFEMLTSGQSGGKLDNEGDGDLDTGEAERREFEALAAQLRALDTGGETREDFMYAHGFPGAAEGYGQQAEQKRKRLFEMLTSGQSGGKLGKNG
ncbi:hypothetical protein ACOMHN_027137 [Nucella lapillus]